MQAELKHFGIEGAVPAAPSTNSLTQTSTAPVSHGSGFDVKLLDAAKALLNRVGVPTNIVGYHFLAHAMVAVYLNLATSVDPKCYFKKEIYPQVATRFNSTYARVERCIRYALREIWLRGEPAEFRALFPGYTMSKPISASHFLTRLAAEIELQLKGS